MSFISSFFPSISEAVRSTVNIFSGLSTSKKVTLAISALGLGFAVYNAFSTQSKAKKKEPSLLGFAKMSYIELDNALSSCGITSANTDRKRVFNSITDLVTTNKFNHSQALSAYRTYDLRHRNQESVGTFTSWIVFADDPRMVDHCFLTLSRSTQNLENPL